MANGTGTGNQERRGTRRRMSDGIKQGIGVLSAFKEALEETIQEARERGDLSTERAKSVMKDALGRAQSAASGAKEKLDFAHRSDLDALRAEVDALRSRLELLEGRVRGLAGLESEPPEDRE